jgi:predicted amidophosphoribosyltransferase
VEVECWLVGLRHENLEVFCPYCLAILEFIEIYLCISFIAPSVYRDTNLACCRAKIGSNASSDLLSQAHLSPARSLRFKEAKAVARHDPAPYRWQLHCAFI